MEIIKYFAIGIFALFLTVMVYFWLKEYRIRNRRLDDRGSDFTGYFLEKGIPESITTAVYRRIQEGCNFKDFPVRPSDNLAGVFGIVDDDLDDLVKEVAAEANLALPQNTEYWPTPVRTVEDLIGFIATFNKLEENNNKIIG